jgi:DnaK suppressor protein
MQNHELKIIKKVINDRLKILTFEDEFNKGASNTVELDQQSIGRLSRMDALQQQAMAIAMGARRQNEKRALKEALYRMNQGDYGDCIDCGETIEFERLKLKPSVLKCLDCMKM